MPRYHFGTLIEVPYITDLQWAPLEHVSGLTFTDTQRAVLVNAMNEYLLCLARVHALPLMRAVRARCKAIHVHASALEHLLRSHPTNDTRDNDAQRRLLQAVFGQFSIRQDGDSLAREMTHLTRNTENVLKRLRGAGQPGAQKGEELRHMILAWHVVYREAGGTGHGCWWSEDSSQYKGAFLALLDAALLQAKEIAASRGWSIPAQKIHPSRHGLAQMILKVVRQPRKSRSKGKKGPDS